MNKTKIVAHRGFAGKYPENTMISMQSAVDQGVRLLELDVQLSKDLVPIVFHDEVLERTTDSKGSVLDSSWFELKEINAGEPKRFGDAFANEKIPSLEVFLKWLAEHPELHAFIEIKDESLDRHGYQVMLDKIIPLCAICSSQVTLIAYDLDFLANAREQGFQKIGWVLTKFSEQEKIQANHHQPSYIICNYKKVNTDLWQGDWQWMFYEITTAKLAQEWVDKGAAFIETMEVEQLLSGLDGEV